MIFRLATRLFILTWAANFVYAQQNITLDDTNPAIVYVPAGAWVLSANSTLDFGGAHMLTQNPNATATFKFIGVAIYFLSPKWPYNVTTAVALDGGAPVLLDLVDHSRPNVLEGPETVQSEIVWSAVGLNNTQHTLVILVGKGQPFGVVDGLIYTASGGGITLVPAIPSTSSQQASTSSSDTSTTTGPVVAPPQEPESSTSRSGKVRAVPIVLGAIFGLIGISVVSCALCFAFKRKRRPKSEAWTIGTQYSSPSSNALANYPGSMSNVSKDGGLDGYAMEQSNSGAWHNTRYGRVTAAVAASISPQGSESYVVTDPSRAPNRYQPGYTLSTITEKSTPRIGEAHPSLANTPASAQSSDLPSGYYTAPASETEGFVSNTMLASRRSPLGAQSQNTAGSPPHPQLPDYSAPAPQTGRTPDRPLQTKAGWI